MIRFTTSLLALCLVLGSIASAQDDEVVRVFIFAGQSNMVGSDSKVEDIKNFPPFEGLEHPQPEVLFSYCIGRENKTRSGGWVELQPVNNIVGPELSFAQTVTEHISAPIAIIKCAAGGTHLGGDWNPDDPMGFKMYPLMLELIKSSLADLDARGISYRLEGFMWHQGENDMFDEEYMANYGKNLKNYLAHLRQDLDAPNLKFYVGELCTKTIWGMDLRPRMYAISLGQREVTSSDPLAEYVPTSHVGVEIGGGVGLHYHYGTLGQLEHGVNYAEAYLRTIGKTLSDAGPTLEPWPYANESKVRLFVLAGHRNMEGERGFTAQLESLRPELLRPQSNIAYRYSLGGGYKISNDWEPLRPTGFYDTFGPELSFVQVLKKKIAGNIAIAKFTHSGSQLNDWTPEGSIAETRNLYPNFIEFVRVAISDLQTRGHEVELAGIVYHLGENEMSMHPYRKEVPKWLQSLVSQSRIDLGMPDLDWFVSQQPPTDHERVNSIDVTSEIAKIAADDEHLFHLRAFDLPPQPKQLVLDTQGIIRLGEMQAEAFLNAHPNDFDE